MPYEIETNPNRLPRDGDVLDDGMLNAVGSPILEVHGNPTDEDVESVSASKIRKNSVIGDKVKDIPLSAFPIGGLDRGDSLIKIGGQWRILKIGEENDILHINGWKPWITAADVGSTIYDGELIANNNTSIAVLKSNFTKDWIKTVIPSVRVAWVHSQIGGPNVDGIVAYASRGINGIYLYTAGKKKFRNTGSTIVRPLSNFNPVPLVIDSQTSEDEIKIENFIPFTGGNGGAGGNIEFDNSARKYEASGGLQTYIQSNKHGNGPAITQYIKDLNTKSGTKIIFPGKSTWDVQADFRFNNLKVDTAVFLNGSELRTPLFTYKIPRYGDVSQTLRRFIVPAIADGDNFIELKIAIRDILSKIRVNSNYQYMGDLGWSHLPSFSINFTEEGYGFQVKLIIQKIAENAVVNRKPIKADPKTINPNPNPSVPPPDDTPVNTNPVVPVNTGGADDFWHRCQ